MYSLKHCAVSLSTLVNNFCTSPSKRINPPFSPPSGPKSITQSDDFITSKLCSITITVFFFQQICEVFLIIS